MEALKEGNLDKAVELLARAVMADDNDVEAKALLGVVYSQKGLHTQAKRALMTAVEREPTNQNYRFNLGVVMERAGDAAGAAVAYRDLLQLNPQHPQARAKLQAMGPAAMNAQRPAGMPPPPGGAAPPPAAIPPPPVMGAPPGYGAPPGGAPPGYGAPPGGAPPGYGAPPMGAPPMGAPPGYGPPGGAPPSPMHGAPPMGAPPIGAPPIGAPPMGAPPMGASPGYGAPPGGAPPGYGAPSMGMGMGGSMPAPPGTVQCPSCGQFPKVGMLCEFCNSPLPPPPKHSAAPPPTYGPPPGVGGPRPGAVPHYGGGGGARMDDSFSVPDGFASWGRVIASPRAFFQEQAGFSGIQGPLGFLMAYSIVYLVISTIASAMRGVTWNGTQVIATVISVPCIWVMSAIVMFIWGGIVHMAAKIVGGQSDYSGSFRAGTYSNAPGMALNLLLALIAPMLMGTGGSPAGGARRSVSASPRPALVAPASAASITLAQTFPRGPGGPAGSPFGSPGSSTSPFGSSGQNPSQMLQTIMSRLLPLMLVGFVGWIWSAITLGIAISEIHQVSGGAAAGAVIISYIISIVIAVVIWIALASVILGIIAAAGSRISG